MHCDFEAAGDCRRRKSKASTFSWSPGWPRKECRADFAKIVSIASTIVEPLAVLRMVLRSRNARSARCCWRVHPCPHKVRTQAALRQLQTAATPGHRVVVANHALLDHAQDVTPRPLPVGHERRALLRRRNGELPVVLGLVVILEPGVRRLDCRDAGQPRLLRQQRPEQPPGNSLIRKPTTSHSMASERSNRSREQHGARRDRVPAGRLRVSVIA